MALGTTGISTSLVASTIGAGSNDVGRLCTHQNVNKWSKWKPVSLPQVTGIDDTQLSNIDFGLIYPRSNNYVVIAGQKWTYNKPVGTASSPFRLGDFRGYYHQAIKLIDCPAVSEINIFENASDVLTFQFPSSIAGQLQMSDFTTSILDQQYLGVVINTTNSGTYIITCPTSVSEGGNQITLDLTAAPFSGVAIGDTFTFYYILSNTLSSTISSSPVFINENLYIPIPNNDNDLSIVQVDIINKYQGVFTSPLVYDGVNGSGGFDSVVGYFGSGDENSPHFITNLGSPYFQIKISNPTSGTISFYRQYMKVKYSSNFWGYERNEDLIVYDSSWNKVTTDISIAANSYVTLYMGTESTLFRNGTALNADIVNPSSGAKANSSIAFLYKNSQVFNFTNFRFIKY